MLTLARHSVHGCTVVLAAALLAGCGGGGGADSDSASGLGASSNNASSNSTTNTGAPATSTQTGGSAGSGAITLQRLQASTYALWVDQLATEQLTVSVGAAQASTVELFYFDGLMGGSGAHITRPMFDDGSHGDALAGDGLWTLTFALALDAPAALRHYDGLVDAVPLSVRAVGEGTADIIEASLQIGVLDRTLEGTVSSRAVGDSLRATDALLNVVDPGFDGQPLSTITERVYQAYPGDPFDFLVIFHTRATGDGIPRSYGVRNDVSGINLGSYDSTAAYGSAGRLQQVVFQNASVMGFEVNHELGHRWGAYLDDPALNLANLSGFHWGASDHVGQMGNGPYLRDDGAGGFEVTNAEGSEHFVSNAFSALELYLMGLAAAQEVAPMRFVTDPGVDTTFGTTLPASAPRLVSIDDIVAVYGPRIPSSAASPNAFRAGFVVVSDAPLSEPEYTLSTLVARYHGSASTGGERSGALFDASDPWSFGAATGFRATLDTQLP